MRILNTLTFLLFSFPCSFSSSVTSKISRHCTQAKPHQCQVEQNNHLSVLPKTLLLIHPQMVFGFLHRFYPTLPGLKGLWQPVDPFLHYCCLISYSSFHKSCFWSVFCPKTAFCTCLYYSAAYWFQASSPICEDQCESWSCSPNQPLPARALRSWIKYSLLQQPIHCWKYWGHNKSLQDPTWQVQLWQWTTDVCFGMTQTLCAHSNLDLI